MDPRRGVTAAQGRADGSTRQVVRRTELLDRLDATRQVTVVRGPRGAGKSVLVDQWLADRACTGTSTVRVSLPPGFEDGAFWTLLAQALEAPPGDGASARARVRTAVGVAPGPLTVVIDHVERVDGPELERELVDLARAHEGLRLVVTTRRRSLFEVLARAELGAQVLGPGDLAFTPREVKDLLAAVGPLDQGEAAAATAHEQFDGWVAPTAVLAGGGLDADESARDFVRVVGDECLPEGLRLVAGEIAVLPHVSVELAEVLAADLDEPDGAVEHLVASGLATVVERAGVRRLHMAPGVRAALAPSQSGSGLAEGSRERQVLSRAGRWYLENGDPAIAAETAWCAKDHDLLAEVLDRHWARLLGRNVPNAARWLAQLPADNDGLRPSIRMWRDLFVDFPSDPVGAGALADDLGDRVADRPMEELATEWLTLLVALRSARVPLVAVPVVEQHRLVIVEKRDEWRALDGASRAVIQVQWGLVALLAGDLPQALEDFTHGYRAGRAAEPAFIARNAAANAAVVCALCGDVAGAQEWLRRAEELPRADGFARAYVEEWEPLAEALLASEACDLAAADTALGRYEPRDAPHPGWFLEAYVRAHVAVCGSRPGEALTALEAARRSNPEANQPGTLPHVLLTSALVDLDLRMGRSAHAAEVLEEAGDAPLLSAARARLALATGDLSGAVAMARAGAALTGPLGFRALDLLVVESVATARQASGDVTAGLPLFADAVARARRTGAVRALALGPRADVLALAGSVPGGVADVGQGMPEAMPEHQVIVLTERERVVLAHLARTAVHREIAAELVVSVNTVKTQIRSLYRKLGATTREEALAAAAKHGFSFGVPDTAS